MMRRRLLEIPISSELYPIGYNLYTNKIFSKNANIDLATGEVISGPYAVSPFLEVNTSYEYTRSYRLYGIFCYDENYNYLGRQPGVNDLNPSVLNPFITGTKYIRTIVLNAYVNNNSLLVMQDGCWLKRTA